MSLYYPMYDWYLCSWNLVHGNITNVVPLLRGIREEEQISAIECGFHRSADKVQDVQSGIGIEREVRTGDIRQDDNDRGFSVCQESETFPDHEAGSHDRCKVEYLQQDLMHSDG